MHLEMSLRHLSHATFGLAHATLGLALLTSVGCADDTTPGTTDEVGDAETETGDTTETDSESGESAETTTETETDTTETETGQTEIMVSGVVTDFFLMTGIEGANISVLDMPGFETVSGDGGTYSISGLPPSTEVFFLLDGNEDAYWGGIRPAMLPDTDQDDLELGQVSNALIDTQLMLVQQQNPDVMADEMKGIVIVRLIQPTATGAVVTFEPPLPADTFYGVDSENKVVLNGNVIDSSLLPFWVAFNVEPADAGTYNISVEHPERECTVLHPSFPTLPRYVTLVEVDCPPPGP